MPKEYRTIQEISGPLMMVTGVEDGSSHSSKDPRGGKEVRSKDGP